nr:aldo/keto reductase [Niastella vici]
MRKVYGLNKIALERGQNLAQMVLSWVLRDKRITSVLLGVSKPEQLTDSLKCLAAAPFTDEELKLIEDVLRGY